MAAPGRALPRAMLGRYRLVCELGAGGMAHVYLGLATGLAGFTKLVVLKVMRDALAQNPEALKLFLGEARLAARLNHPNVVQTLEVGEDAGSYFIGMEYLEGLPLGALLGDTRKARLPLAMQLEIACQMLDGLSYLHNLSNLDGSPLGLVHRDISPSNIFVTFDGTVKVLDFGVAKAAGLSEVSVLGTFKGKFGYAAPEQIKGQSDARSDIFTAGLLLWEVLCYRRLGLNRTQTEIIRGRVAGADAEVMHDRGQGLPPELLAICLKAAAADPAARYQSAAEFREALRAYMQAHALQSSPEQLRALMTERFSELRQTTREHIDQRMKAVLEGGGDAPPDVTTRFTSQTPTAFTGAPGTRSAFPAERKSWSVLTLAGTLAIVLLAGSAGALVVRSGLLDRTAAVEPAQVPATHGSSAASSTAAPAASDDSATLLEAANEPPALDLAITDTQVNERSVRGDPPSTGRRRPTTRAVPQPRRAAPATTGPAKQGANAPPTRTAQEATGPSKASASESSDFIRDSISTKSARPIDSASPYSN